MSAAKTGDTVQSIECRCGTQLVAMWGVPTWACPACKQRARRGQKYRLLDVGWEPLFDPMTPGAESANQVQSSSPEKGVPGTASTAPALARTHWRSEQ